MSKLIGVTGATGFIGGAICYELKKRGYTVIGADIVKRRHILPFIDDFFHRDFADIPGLHNPIWKECSTIIHCAGTSLVGPSTKYPSLYYQNNVAKTIRLLDWCSSNNIHFMFSSSASVYKTQDRPIHEDDIIYPISPYAKSKRMVEQIIEDFTQAYGLQATVFRYFNACGAVPKGIHGQDPEASHIFPRLFECEGTFHLNGMDFNTPDGTCVRDYIHVLDIAQAHIKAMEKKITGVYNLGNGIGFSNLDIINSIGKSYKNVGRRKGDSDTLVADITTAKYMLGWTPTHTLTDIVNDLKDWYSSENFLRLKDETTGNI